MIKLEFSLKELVLISSGLSDYRDRVEKVKRKEPKRRAELDKVLIDIDNLKETVDKARVLW